MYAYACVVIVDTNRMNRCMKIIILYFFYNLCEPLICEETYNPTLTITITHFVTQLFDKLHSNSTVLWQLFFLYSINIIYNRYLTYLSRLCKHL